MIEVNEKMKEMLECITNIKINSIRSFDLLELLFPNFIEIDGCILLKNYSENIKKLNTDFIYKVHRDRTGYEASCNHIHISCDLINSYNSSIYGLKFATKVMEIWGKILKRDFPKYKFYLILSCNENDITLRFHKFRKEDASWIDINDLESYEQEAILVKEI